MGYLMPINHLQYEQYSARVIAKQDKTLPFIPVQQIKPLNTFSQKYSQKKQPESWKRGKNSLRSKEKMVNNHIYSELTGKGSIFNCQV